MSMAAEAVPLADGPLYIVTVTRRSASSPPPLKEGVRLLMALPLSGLSIVTFGGAAIAVPAGPTAIATSQTAAARKSPPAAFLIGSRSEPCHTRARLSSLGYLRHHVAVALAWNPSLVARGVAALTDGDGPSATGSAPALTGGSRTPPHARRRSTPQAWVDARNRDERQRARRDLRHEATVLCHRSSVPADSMVSRPAGVSHPTGLRARAHEHLGSALSGFERPRSLGCSRSRDVGRSTNVRGDDGEVLRRTARRLPERPRRLPPASAAVEGS